MKNMDMRTETFSCEKRKKMGALGVRVLQACRNELYARYPYLDGAFASLEYEAYGETGGIGTDGASILFQPDFLLESYVRDPGKVRRGYLHMLIHCLFLHPFQKKIKDRRLWNLACDMAVEQILEREWAGEGEKIKKECLGMLGGKGLSTQEIYEMLEQGRFPFETGEMEQAFYFDDHGLWVRNEEDQENLRKKWERILVYTTRGKERTHRAGANKGNKKEDLEALSGGRYDYRKFLKQFAFPREEVELDTESFDYVFYHFGMEHYGNMPLIEPLEYKEVNRLEELVIAIDTSGSCSRETVRKFLEETYAILSSRENFFKKMKVYILQCDCYVQNETVIHSEEEWKEYSKKITIEGRSGTDFRPVFRYVERLQEKKELRNLKALIYFTDGDGIYPREKPDYETAFVFVKKTETMNLVPPWAHRLLAV